MSIFGKADQDLPLLTKVFQVDVNNFDELRQFAHEWILTHAAFENVARTRGGKVPRTDEEWRSFQLTSDQDVSGKAVRQAHDLVLLAQRIMCDLCDRGGVQRHDLDDLSAALRRMFRIYATDSDIAQDAQADALVAHGEKALNPPEDANVKSLVVPINSVRVLVGGLEEDYVFSGAVFVMHGLILQATDALILDVQAEKVQLRRCAECNNVFIARREDHRYCSHRCTNRISQRQRDRKKRAGIDKSVFFSDTVVVY